MPATPVSIIFESSSPAPRLRGGGKRKHEPWTHAMDAVLVALRADGNSWNAVAKSFPGKKSNACRKRWERCMKTRKEASWDKGRSLERIALAYANTRQNMWGELIEELAKEGGLDAKKLGWEKLEAKCMKHGVKALLTASKAAARRKANGEVAAVDEKIEAEELVDSIMADDEGDSEDEDEEEYDSSIIRTATTSTFEDSGLEMKEESSIEDTKDDSLIRGETETPVRQMPLPAAAILSTQRYSTYSPSPPVSSSVRRLREEAPRPRHTSHPPTIASMLRSPSPSPEVQTVRATVEVGVEVVDQKTEYKREASLFVRA